MSRSIVKTTPNVRATWLRCRLFFWGKMKTIRCQNIYKDETGSSHKCGRILAVLTDLQVDLIKIDEEKPIFRCPECRPEARWQEVGFDKETKTFICSIVPEKPELKTEDNLEFEELETCIQVG
jgi:hypothetical protein